MVAILFRDYSSFSLPFFCKMKLGVYSNSHILKGINTIEGSSINHPAIIFQSSINIANSETIDMPIENIICKAIIDLSRFFPTINYLRNV